MTTRITTITSRGIKIINIPLSEDDYNIIKLNRQLKKISYRQNDFNLSDFKKLNLFDDRDVKLINKLKAAKKYYYNNREKQLTNVKLRQKEQLGYCSVCNKQVYQSHYKSDKHLKNYNNYLNIHNNIFTNL